MRIVLDAEEQPAGTKVLDDQRICVLDERTPPGRDLLHEGAVRLDRHQHRQPVLVRHLHVLCTERRRHVNQTGTVFGRDEVPKHHEVRGLVRRHEREQGMVLRALQLSALERIDDLHLFLLEDALDQRLRENELLGCAVMLAALP